MIFRKLTSLTVVASASFALAACSGNEESTTATTPATTSETTAAARGEDPAFAAIDSVLAEHAEGIITNIDRDDSRDRYDIDVVVGQEVLELEVDSSGALREEERESDDDDIRKAQAATVTAAEAITEALSQHTDGVLDDIELDDEDGRLEWDISLDNAEGNDLVELTIPAT